MLIPCSDCKHEHPGSLNQEKIDHVQQHSNDCEGDNCTPFCNCSCCRIHVVFRDTSPVSTNNPPEFFNKQGVLYIDTISCFDQEPAIHPPIA